MRRFCLDLGMIFSGRNRPTAAGGTTCRAHWGVPVMLLWLASFAPAMIQQGSLKTEYYRSEKSFKQGIKLFPFEVHEAGYLKVVYNDRGFVETLQWFSRQDACRKAESTPTGPMICPSRG